MPVKKKYHLPAHDAWMKKTAAGTFKPRSKELREIDEGLLAYSKATTEYSEDWIANELRIALDAWKKAKGAKWKGNERNKTGIIEDLDKGLPKAKTNFIGSGSNMEGETATKLRHSVLFFLANCSTSPVPKNLEDFMQDGTDVASDMQTLVRTGNNGGWRVTNGQFYDKDNKASSFLGEASKKIIEYVKELANYMSKAGQFISSAVETAVGYSLAEAAATAAKFIADHIPDLLVKILGGLLSKISTLVDIAKGLAKAGDAAFSIWKSRDFSKAILAGAPREIIGSVRDQIKSYGYGGIKDAAKAAVLAGISFIPGAGDVIGAIASAVASVYAFVTKVFDHIRDTKSMAFVFETAKGKLDDKLHETAPLFNRWFRGTIAFLPLISSYCMAMPMTGSYYGFLTLASTDGSEMAYKQLERNYALFNDVKKWAVKFVTESSVKVYSANEIVSLSLHAARGGVVWESASTSLLDRGIKVVVDRGKKLGMGAIESAISG